MRVSDILARIANTKTGQKVIKWATQPNKEKMLNHTLPQIETILATSCYVYSTAKQKNIDKERKQLLQIQNVGSGLVGLFVAGAANRWIGNKTEEIIKYIDPKKIDPKSLRQISTGLRVGAPILTTAIVMRMALPTLIAGFSGKLMDKARAKQQENKLDVKA